MEPLKNIIFHFCLFILASIIKGSMLFIDTNSQVSNADGTYERPYLNFSIAFANLQTINQTENRIFVTPGNIINDIEIPLLIGNPLSIIAFGFESEENAIINIYSQGSFLVYGNLMLKKLTIILHNSIQMTSFINLMEGASLTMQVNIYKILC